MEKRQVAVGDLKLTKEDKELINKVLDSNRLSYGPVAQEFEKEFAKLHDSKFGIFTNSGTSSLHIALAALKEKYGWQDGDEIIVPAITFVATSNVVIHNNLKPVFVDVDSKTYNIDAYKIEEKITPKTRAIIPVHLLGLPCDMDLIMKIAKKYNLRVIEDSAETMFAKYKGKSVGSFGDIACFSTYIAHYIVTGVGGMNVTSDSELAVILRSLMNHGRDSIYISIDDDNNVQDETKFNEILAKRFKFVRLGHSFRATEMEAALGLSQLRRKDDIVKKRKYVAQKYIEGLKDLDKHIQLPAIPPDRDHTFMLFGIVLINEDKWELVKYLEAHGIETRELLPLINQPIYQKLFGDIESNYPVSAWLNKSGIYIGCHQYITDEDIDYVVKVFHDYFKSK